MRTIFLKIKGLLKEVAGLTYVDLDRGQLESDKPSVKFPCALINIAYPQCDDLVGKEQKVKCIISIKLGFDFANDNTSSAFTDEKTELALAYFDVVEGVYSKLQGYYDDEVEELSRKSLAQGLSGALKVTIMPFETYFNEVG